jgi:hypothetical protein
MKMVSKVMLVALALVLSPLPARAGETMIYRVELGTGATLLARTPPVARGNRLVFARHPDGAVVSLKREDVRRVVSAPVAATPPTSAARTFRPGQLIILGPTGEGAGGAAGAGARTAAATGTRTAPGQSPDGTALLNPSRDYRPAWDSSQVPGQNLAYPASPGDYREGMTFAFPPGTAVQTAPGQPPTGVPSGEPPKSPQ